MSYDKQYVIYSQEGIELSLGEKLGSVTGIHAHESEYQFEVLLSGKSRSLLSNEETLNPGFIEVYNPTDKHEIEYCNTESFIFHVHINALNKTYRELQPSSTPPIFDNSIKKECDIPLSILHQEMAILKKMNEISHLNPKMAAYQKNKVLLLLRSILTGCDNIHDHSSWKEQAKRNKVRKTHQWIQAHFHQDNITIAYLAELSHLSPFHFIRVFKAIYGKPPYHYLIEKRVSEAIKIIEGKNYKNLEEVSVSVGLRNAAQLRYYLKRKISF